MDDNKTIEKYMPMGYAIARKISPGFKFLEDEDLEQVTARAILAAVRSFNPTSPKAASFTTYVYRVIQNAMVAEVRAAGKHTTRRSHVCPHEYEPEDRRGLDLDGDLFREDVARIVRQAVEELPATERAIVSSLYGIGREARTSTDLSRELRCTKRTIAKYRAVGVNRLRVILHQSR